MAALALALLMAVGACAFATGGSAQGEEPVKATMFLVSSRVESSDSEVTKAFIRDTLGVDLELILSIDGWEQKYALLVSSGDIPDISVLPPVNFNDYAAQGAYADLTDLVGDYDALTAYVPEEMWPRVSVDGSIYGIPSLNTAGKWNITYREDWLEKLGLPVPQTIEEFTEAMRAFSEDDPDGNGISDTYGYGNNNLNMFYGMFGGAPGFYHLQADGTVEIGSINKGYKQALQYYKDLFDKHYVDPEALTQKSEQFWQRFVQNKIGSWVGWWSEYHAPYQSYEFGVVQPDAKLLTTFPVKGPDGKTGMVASDPLGNVVAISYKSKNIEKLLNYINWNTTDMGYRVSRYGVEGIYFSMEGDELAYLYNRDPEHRNLQGVPVEGDVEIFCIFNRVDIYPELLMGETLVQQMSYTGYSQARDNPLLVNDFLGLTTEAFQTKMPDLTKFVDEMRVKFILGDVSFDNWDAYVDEYFQLGGLEVAESLLVEYNKMHGTEAVLASYK
jgi:ABC-type glycerol-3-phosphate transport system substrate-binding protein